MDTVAEPPATARTPASPYLTSGQAAAYLNISLSTFYKKRKFIRRARGTRRFRREDLDAFAESAKPRRKG